MLDELYRLTDEDKHAYIYLQPHITHIIKTFADMLTYLGSASQDFNGNHVTVT